MKIVLIMVMTADGVIAKDKDHNSFDWTSIEDKNHYSNLTKKIGAFLMGGNTFLASGRKSFSERTGFILTNHPQNYKAGKNIYFVAGSPKEVIRQVKEKGFKEIALVGGASTNFEYIKQNLVDEIYLTIEPVIFGKGLHLTEQFNLDVKLKLISVNKLNKSGTLLVHYKILK